MTDLRRRGRAGASQLDDDVDRAELRDRYYGLLQELRVVVTGVQVLLAFLLAVPFAPRFADLDADAQAWYGVALVSATLSVVAFVTPTAMHRYGKRTARGDRLAFSIVATRVGLVLLGVAIVLSFAVVVTFLFDGATAVVLVGGVGLAVVGAWIALPLATHLTDRD